MGFEQLAELRDRLRAEKVQVKTDSPKQRVRKPSPQTKPREQDPAVEAIWRLQKHFPLAFPVNPAPKVPLKEGILKDAEQHLELLEYPANSSSRVSLPGVEEVDTGQA